MADLKNLNSTVSFLAMCDNDEVATMEVWLSSVEDALQDLRQGKMIIVTNDGGLDSEGELVIAAEKITPQAVNFMATHGRGLIKLSLTGLRCDELSLPLMNLRDCNGNVTPFTVSIDYKNTTTGISAFERANTIKSTLDPAAIPEDLRRPGHVFPIRVAEGGVLQRADSAEASLDLSRLAGLYPAGVTCEILREDGSMARGSELIGISQRYDLKIISIEDLIRFRQCNEKLIQRMETARLPTKYGDFSVIAYESLIDRKTHLALIKGEIHEAEAPLVRIHSQCLVDDVFGSLRCNGRAKLDRTLDMIARKGTGVLIYLRKTTSVNDLLSTGDCQLINQKSNLVEDKKVADCDMKRGDIVAAQILVDLGLRKIRILTNNFLKVCDLAGYGLIIVEQVPI